MVNMVFEKNTRHVYLKIWNFLCILIYEFPNTNKMGTGLQNSLHYKLLIDLLPSLASSLTAALHSITGGRSAPEGQELANTQLGPGQAHPDSFSKFEWT